MKTASYTGLFSSQVVHIVIGDGLPKFVCMDCERIVSNFSDFCNMVQNVQKRLEEEKFSFSEVRQSKNYLCYGACSCTTMPGWFPHQTQFL